jgi:hypothetical protein
MKVQLVASALPFLWPAIAVFSRSLAGLDAIGMPFLGFNNMALSSYLRSDYPLNLTLLEPARVCALTWFCVTVLTPRMILISPLRHNAPFPISFYQRYCTNSCSFAWVPLARKSPFGLMPACASPERVPASYRRAFDDSDRTSICKCTRLNISASPASSLFRKSPACAVVGFVLQRGTEGVHLVASPCVVLSVEIGASRVR